MIKVNEDFEVRITQARGLARAVKVMAQGLSMPDECEGLHSLAIALEEQLEAIGLGIPVEADGEAAEEKHPYAA